MVVKKVDSFGGMVPAVDSNLLPDNAAANCSNAWLYSGAIAGMNTPTSLRTLGSSTSKVYRIPSSFQDTEHLDDATWVEFDNIDTDILRASVIGDTFKRYYFASSSSMPSYNTEQRILAGNTGANAPFLLGIPAPAVAPVITRTGGVSTINRTTAYVYTWVSAYDEEGQPSPPTLDTGAIDATWNIKLTNPVATDLGALRNITHARIYRTVTSASGVATYFLVAEIPSGVTISADTHTNTTIDDIADTSRIGVDFVVTGSGVAASTVVTVVAANSVTVNNATSTSVGDTPITFTAAYNDTQLDSVVAQNNLLQSTNWSGPPTDLQGFVAMPNGIFAGWRENEIWFCEPYRPHAWPAIYALAVDYPIVGLGVVGQTLVVGTQSYPYAIHGIHPASMSQARLAALEPCVSRGSVLSAPEGVYYASPNGLVVVNLSGAIDNISLSSGLITKDKWQALVGSSSLATLRAARLGAAYYAWGSSRPGVFDSEAFDNSAFAMSDFSGAYTGFVLDPINKRVAFTSLSNAVPMTNVQNDPWTGELFVIRAVSGVNSVYWIDIAADAPTYETFVWRSKIFQMPQSKNLGAVRVYWDTPATSPALNPVPNVSLVQTLAADQWGLLRCYADGTLKWTRELRTSGELMRLPKGFAADYYQFEIESRMYIKSFQFASSAKELKSV